MPSNRPRDMNPILLREPQSDPTKSCRHWPSCGMLSESLHRRQMVPPLTDQVAVLWQRLMRRFGVKYGRRGWLVDISLLMYGTCLHMWISKWPRVVQFCVLHSCSIGPAVQYCPAHPRGSNQGKAGCKSHGVATVIEQKYSEVSSFAHSNSVSLFRFCLLLLWWRSSDPAWMSQSRQKSNV